jgi:hypothetical protein
VLISDVLISDLYENTGNERLNNLNKEAISIKLMASLFSKTLKFRSAIYSLCISTDDFCMFTLALKSFLIIPLNPFIPNQGSDHHHDLKTAYPKS